MTDEMMRRGALFIREAAIDWDVVPRDSSLRNISALKGFSRLAFESNVTFEEAKYMLVSCSAFVNYLIAVSGKGSN